MGFVHFLSSTFCLPKKWSKKGPTNANRKIVQIAQKSTLAGPDNFRFTPFVDCQRTKNVFMEVAFLRFYGSIFIIFLQYFLTSLFNSSKA